MNKSNFFTKSETLIRGLHQEPSDLVYTFLQRTLKLVARAEWAKRARVTLTVYAVSFFFRTLNILMA